MPKIRLSALATDIKGKAGGSVFARNSGGTYFRNNPSGTGSKKEVAAIQKQKFGTLSTQWRKLTADQKAAWKNAVTDYPTTNAFGESRLPSGYELFMRLNGVLISANLPILNVPGVKREAPLAFEWYYTTPESFCFTPDYVAAFPAYVSPFGNIGICNAGNPCPDGYTCFGGLCYPAINTPNLDEPECSTNDDCSAAGFGTGNDVECQGGECVYVGDGTMPVNSNAFGVAVGPAVPLEGNWSFDDDQGGEHQLTTSIRIIPDATWKTKLSTPAGFVQILGNYKKPGAGLGIYIMGLEPDTALIVMQWGVATDDIVTPSQTTVFTFPISTDLLTQSFHIGAYLDTNVLSNSTLYFNGIELDKETPNCYAGLGLDWYFKMNDITPSVGVCGLDWHVTDKYFYFVIGAGYIPSSLPFAFSDFRMFNENLTSRDHLLLSRGYVLGNEAIAIPFNTEKDNLSNLAGPTKFQIRAVYMQAIVSIMNPAEAAIPSNLNIDWFSAKGSPFNPNPTVFVPFVEVYTPDEGLVDWTFNVKTTGPFNDSKSIDHQTTRSILTMETVAANYAEIGGLMGQNFGNFPNNSAFGVDGYLIDMESGDIVQPKPKVPPYAKPVRFKAGAELSGKVN